MTIKDIAGHLHISWDTVKQIQKASLKQRYRSIPLKEVEQIAIDEISIGKGHQYLTIVMDLKSGRILHVGDGRGGDAIEVLLEESKNCKGRYQSGQYRYVSGISECCHRKYADLNHSF